MSIGSIESGSTSALWELLNKNALDDQEDDLLGSLDVKSGAASGGTGSSGGGSQVFDPWDFDQDGIVSSSEQEKGLTLQRAALGTRMKTDMPASVSEDLEAGNKHAMRIRATQVLALSGQEAETGIQAAMDATA